jgi:hypothetical protein
VNEADAADAGCPTVWDAAASDKTATATRSARVRGMKRRGIGGIVAPITDAHHVAARP